MMIIRIKHRPRRPLLLARKRSFHLAGPAHDHQPFRGLEQIVHLAGDFWRRNLAEQDVLGLSAQR